MLLTLEEQTDQYNIVFLIKKEYFDTKMSRIRFHSIRALFNHTNVNGIYTGPGWDNWDSNLSPQDNIYNIIEGKRIEGTNQQVRVCHLVIGYKPLEISGFEEIKFYKCIRYNEMYDKEWTLKEITDSNANVVICHHYNDYVEYRRLLEFFKSSPEHATLYSKLFKNIKCMTWIPHSAEASIFKPKPEIEKKYDVALVGATNVTTMLGEHYPLRARMARLLNLMPSKYKCGVIPHVGGSHSDAYTDKYAIDFANKINSAKIIITDSGAPNSRFGKYIEVPMCGTALAGDLYDDHPEDVKKLKSFLIEINMQMSDQEIIKKLVYYLENDEERNKLVKKGLEYTRDFTQEQYATRVVNLLEQIRAPHTNRSFNKYEDYVELQKEKTNDPEKRKTWLTKEWDYKTSGFRKIFDKNIKYIGNKCLCIGARTGQEVQALKDLNKDAIGVDLVACEPLVIEGDFHNLDFKDETFDFIFTNVLDHALYPSKFCSEMIRVLKPGGFALLHLQLFMDNDKYAVYDIKNIQTDFFDLLPPNTEVINESDITYQEFLTLNKEVLIKKT